MNIRKATVGDVTDISKLYLKLTKAMADLQPFFFKEETQEESFIKKLIEENTSDILLACNGKEVEGFAFIQEQVTPPFAIFHQHRFAYFLDLLVRPEQQGKGIGTKLINACKEWSKERELDYIQLSVLTNNHSAIQLYKRQGFEEQSLNMYHKL